jgi:sulfatase modifying factor 1
MKLMLFAVVIAAVPFTAQAVTMDWVTVGGAGNVGDAQESCRDCGPGTNFGAVPYEYQIGKYEVTNAQYTEFLNVVAATDTYELYNTAMGDPNPGGSGYGGITRSGSSGSYFYNTIAGREDMPVNHVSFFDILRFANWLNNGQGSGDTETGAYTLLGGGPIATNWPTLVRNEDAQIFLPSEDEWYKAAYYDEVAGYFEYPMGSDTLPTCSTPVATANTANCWGSATGVPVPDLTAVGSYTGSASPNGTFDQGGNVWEYSEDLIGFNSRGLRGGSISFDADALAASNRLKSSQSNGQYNIGFRVAGFPTWVPEPSVALLHSTALLVLMGLAASRRKN